jgi:hypothetical protein
MTESDVEYLRDLAERLMHVPVMHGVDQGDVSRLHEIATKLEEIEFRMSQLEK